MEYEGRDYTTWEETLYHMEVDFVHKGQDFVHKGQDFVPHDSKIVPNEQQIRHVTLWGQNPRMYKTENQSVMRVA